MIGGRNYTLCCCCCLLVCWFFRLFVFVLFFLFFVCIEKGMSWLMARFKSTSVYSSIGADFSAVESCLVKF